MARKSKEERAKTLRFKIEQKTKLLESGFYDNPRGVKDSLRQLTRNLNRLTGEKNPVPFTYGSSGSDFFKSRDWRELRYKVLSNHGGKCMLCGRGAKDGVVIHVDHIKPRSLRPELELDIDNLQILCDDCNIGKSNKDDTDWR